MAYKLIITERAEALLDNILYHIIYRLKNEQAAMHLLDSMERIYCRLESNPFQFAECRDIYLIKRGYREAVLPDMDFVVIYSVDQEEALVSILGVFQEREDFGNKL